MRKLTGQVKLGGDGRGKAGIEDAGLLNGFVATATQITALAERDRSFRVASGRIHPGTAKASNTVSKV